MSRNQMGTWIERLLFFILFTGYYLGVITIAWDILSPDKNGAIEAFTKTDLTCLAWSAACGFLLTILGVSNATLNLKAARQSGDLVFIFKNIIDILLCASIVLLPLMAIYNRLIIQEMFNPHLWIGVVGVFLAGSAFHYRRAKNTRKRLLGERLFAH